MWMKEFYAKWMSLPYSKEKPEDVYKRQMVDRAAKRAEGKGIGYDRWAAVHNLKQMAATVEMCIRDRYLLLDKEVGKLRRELSRISKRKSDLYEDYSERLITEEEYIQLSLIHIFRKVGNHFLSLLFSIFSC